MDLFRVIPIEEYDEREPVQYVGVYVLKWRPEWGEPEILFAPVSDERKPTLQESMMKFNDEWLNLCLKHNISMRAYNQIRYRSGVRTRRYDAKCETMIPIKPHCPLVDDFGGETPTLGQVAGNKFYLLSVPGIGEKMAEEIYQAWRKEYGHPEDD